MDELDSHIAESMKDPAFARAYRKAEARAKREIQVSCAWGNCTHMVDPLDGKIVSGIGPMLCPCDHLPGWSSPRVQGQAKPAVPVKVGGRHGSRVQRSRRRHALPDYSDLGDWLPARPTGR